MLNYHHHSSYFFASHHHITMSQLMTKLCSDVRMFGMTLSMYFFLILKAQLVFVRLLKACLSTTTFAIKPAHTEAQEEINLSHKLFPSLVNYFSGI